MHEVMHEAGHDLPVPLARMTYADAMERYGSDRPDTRFGLELVDVSGVFADCEFKVFSGALASGGAIKAINAKGAGDWSRGRIDALNQFAIDSGAKGLAWVAFTSDGEVRSPIAKFFTDDEMAALAVGDRRGAGRPRVHGRRRPRRRERGARRPAAQAGGRARDRAGGLRRAVGRRLPALQVGRRGRPLGGEPPSVHASLRRAPRDARRRSPARRSRTRTTSS